MAGFWGVLLFSAGANDSPLVERKVCIDLLMAVLPGDGAGVIGVANRLTSPQRFGAN